MVDDGHITETHLQEFLDQADDPTDTEDEEAYVEAKLEVRPLICQPESSPSLESPADLPSLSLDQCRSILSSCESRSSPTRSVPSRCLPDVLTCFYSYFRA